MFIWVRGQPNFKGMHWRRSADDEPNADELTFCDFWTHHCRADQYDPAARAEKSPAARTTAEIERAVFTDLAESLNDYQMHSICRPGTYDN